MSCEKCNLLMILLICMILLPCVRSQDETPHVCMQNGYYTSNSTYGANLNTSISSLITNMENEGFNNASVGRNPDRANAVALCRADKTLDQCRTCIQKAAVELLRLCPNQRQAIIWSDQCMLRYSNESIYGPQTNDPEFVRNGADVTGTKHFREYRTTLLDDLRVRAANGSSVMKAAAGSRNISDSDTLYGMMQCTPDLSPEECNNCLLRAGHQMSSCCNDARGVRMLMSSCNIRYELYSFYNETRLRELQALLPPAPPSPAKDDNTTRTAIIVVVSTVVCLLLAVFVGFLLRKTIKQKSKEKLESESDENDIITVEPIQYDFAKIRAATDDFPDANRLGQDGFGDVYRGKLVNGQEIVIKRLSKDSGQSNLEFKSEVSLLAKLRHRNLARISGFSVEETERLLVYEVVQNGSLDKFVFDPTKRSNLDWAKRCKIIEGIARGLLYIHEDSGVQIIHHDLRASNILLDRKMNPKILNFGAAKSFVGTETEGSTNGTYDYAMNGKLFDVFSFGLLVLEIVSGQKNDHSQSGKNAENLLSSTWKNWRKGKAANMIDPVLRADPSSLNYILRCIHIGLLCVQENVADRPTMASVVLMLNYFSLTLPVPSKPASIDG